MNIINNYNFLCMADLLILKPIFLVVETFLVVKVSSNFSIALVRFFYDTPLHEIFCFPSSFSIIYDFEHNDIIFVPSNSNLNLPTSRLPEAI